ncbi:MAG: hypothetical protein M1812_000423 [Candelaria pacifica]|nr:MAG: hypothetical protein M1812_000423 [Candelaria pacifica]
MTSSSSSSGRGHLSTEALQELAAGDHRLALTGAGHPWPVIICDGGMLPKDVPRPATAKIINETQSSANREDESGLSEWLPVLYLGMNKRAWVLIGDLYPMDSEISMLDVNNMPSDLQEAHTIASKYYPLDFFKDEAMARTLACDADTISTRQNLSQPPEAPTNERRIRRRRGPGPKLALQAPRTTYNEDDDDDELFIKEEVHEGFVMGPDPGGLHDEPSGRDGPSQERGSKRLRQGDRADISILIKEEEPQDDHTISVHIGRTNRKFDIRRSELSKSPVLLQGVVYGIGRKPYVMNPDLMVLEVRDFETIEQYLKTSEYHPHLIDEGTGLVHLAGLETVQERQKGCAPEVIRCGRVYCMAGFFQLPSLQDLVLRKLKAIEAYAAGPILATTKFVFQNMTYHDDPLRLYLINFIAENFRELNLQNVKAFWDTLDSSDDLHIAVFRRKAEIINDFGVLVKVQDD